MAYVVANMKLVVVHIFPLVKPLKRNGGREKVGILFGLLMTSNLAVFQKLYQRIINVCKSLRS
jgi:hypothetical protein